MTPRSWKPAKIKASEHRPTIFDQTVPALSARKTAAGFKIIAKEDTPLGLMLMGAAALVSAFFLAGALESLFDHGLVMAVFLLAVAFGFAWRKRPFRRFVRKLMTLHKLDGAELHLSDWPLVLGDRTRILFRRRPRGGETIVEISARLLCCEKAVKGCNEDAVEKSDIVWAQEYESVLPRSPEPGVYEASWEVAIPADGMQSLQFGSNEVRWTLEIVTRLDDGVKDPSTFVLAVFPGPQG